jgi:hypothetical protein
MPNNNLPPVSGQFVLYQDDNGITNVNVRFDDKDVWLTQQQITELFMSSRTNVVEHIANIYQEGELVEDATCRNFRQVRLEGNRRVTREFEEYRSKEMLQYESDFDKAIKELTAQANEDKK